MNNGVNNGVNNGSPLMNPGSMNNGMNPGSPSNQCQHHDLPMAPLGDGSKEDNQKFIVNRRKTYSKSKQMSVFHYTLRHARQYSKINEMSLEWNFKHLEEKRKLDLKNGNAKPLSDF